MTGHQSAPSLLVQTARVIDMKHCPFCGSQRTTRTLEKEVAHYKAYLYVVEAPIRKCRECQNTWATEATEKARRTALPDALLLDIKRLEDEIERRKATAKQLQDELRYENKRLLQAYNEAVK